MSFQWECSGMLHINRQKLVEAGIGQAVLKLAVWDEHSFDDNEGVLHIAYDDESAAGDVDDLVFGSLQWLAELGTTGEIYGSNSEGDHWCWSLHDGHVFKRQGSITYGKEVVDDGT